MIPRKRGRRSYLLRILIAMRETAVEVIQAKRHARQSDLLSAALGRDAEYNRYVRLMSTEPQRTQRALRLIQS